MVVTGVPIVAAPNVSGTVNVAFENWSLEEALELVLAGKPYVFKRMPRYYLVADRGMTAPASQAAETRRIRLSYVPPSRAKVLLSPAFAPYVQIEPSRAQDSNDEGNTLIVTAPPALTERIIADIKKIDRPRRQVFLDARVVVLEPNDLQTLGVEWSRPPVRSTALSMDTPPQTIVPPMGCSPDRAATASLMTALNQLQENGRADIIANPELIAQDGREAQMKVTQEQWFMMTTPDPNCFINRAGLSRIESGTVMMITPYVGDNNDIMLQMAVEVSDSIPKARGSDLPLVTRRTARTAVTIKDGGTVVVSGLVGNRSKSSGRRAPVLADIPLLGELFKNRNSDKSGRELVVFITAHLIPDVYRAPAPAEVAELKAQLQREFQRRIPSARVIPIPAANQSTSQAWSILRQPNAPPLLLGLTQQLLRVLQPARQNDAMWQEVAGGGSLTLDVKVERETGREVVVGLFRDAKWSQEPVAVRRLPKEGTYTLTGLPAGQYQIGAMIGRAPSAAALGVQRTWPEAIEIRPGRTTEAQLLVARDFAFNASGWYNREVARDYTGDWSLLDENHLLQGRLTGPDGQPIRFGEVQVREYQAGPTDSIAAPNLGTNEEGAYKFDGMKWPYRVGALWRDPLPAQRGYRYQYQSLNHVFEGPQQVDFQFERFPPGVAKLAGRVVDQDGRAVTEFFLRVKTTEFSASLRQGRAPDPDGKTYTGFGYKVPFVSPDGTFELGGLPEGPVSVDVVAFDNRQYKVNPGKDVTLEAGKTTSVQVELTRNKLFYGRVLFEDGRPAVIRPAPWEGARTTLRIIDETFPFGRTVGYSSHDIAEADADGWFTVYFLDRELQSLQSGAARLRIRLPGRRQDEWQLGGVFPFEKLAEDKAYAGTVTIQPQTKTS